MPEGQLVIFDCDGVLVDMRVLGYAGGLTPADRLEGPDTVVFTDMADLPGLVASA